MTWHKNDALSKQAVYVQINILYQSVNVYKTPCAWQEMHSCTQEKQWSLQEEGLKGYRVIALWLCRRVNETSDVHYKNNNMPSLLPHSTRMCAYREDYTEISQPLGHIRQPQGSRTKRSCTYRDSGLSSARNSAQAQEQIRSSVGY